MLGHYDCVQLRAIEVAQIVWWEKKEGLASSLFAGEIDHLPTAFCRLPPSSTNTTTPFGFPYTAPNKLVFLVLSVGLPSFSSPSPSAANPIHCFPI